MQSLHITAGADDVTNTLLHELIETYVLALRRLVKNLSYTPRQLKLDADINVIMLALDLHSSDLNGLGKSCIVVNFEQLTAGSRALNDNYLNILRNGYVWEYSNNNISKFESYGIKDYVYCPYGYISGAGEELTLDQCLAESKRDIDVLFFGTPSPRRQFIISELLRRKVRVVANEPGYFWTNDLRDNLIDRSKLVLNIHSFSQTRIVEVVRLGQLFRRRKVVVCELYPDSELSQALRDVVFGVPYDQLVDTICLLLGAPKLRQEMESRVLPAF